MSNIISLGKTCMVCGFSQNVNLEYQVKNIDPDSRTITVVPACNACFEAKNWIKPRFRFDMWPVFGRWDFLDTSRKDPYVGRILRCKNGDYSATIFGARGKNEWMPSLKAAAEWLVEQSK